MTETGEVLHASCVAVDGQAVLILGPSGSGKSSLALRLISLGAVLISDDQTRVARDGPRLMASCPKPELLGLIEARGIGLLRAPALGSAPVAVVVDLAQRESDRLPPLRTVTILGCELALVLHPQNDHFPDALMLYLRHGRQA